MNKRYYDEIFNVIFNNLCETTQEDTNSSHMRKENSTMNKNVPVQEKKPDVLHVESERTYKIPRPVRIICNDPATIVYWDDGSKTVVKCDSGKLIYNENGEVVGYEREPDTFTAEGGLSAAYIKRLFGSRCEFKRLLNMVEYSKPKKVKSNESIPESIGEKEPEYEQLTFDFGDDKPTCNFTTKSSESEVNE